MRSILEFLAAFVLSIFAIAAQATPVTLTGVDLLASSAVSFPNGEPVLDADVGIVFNQPADSSILFSVALNEFIGSPDRFSVVLNANRRSSDFDLSLAITDGVRGVGAHIADNSGGQLFTFPDISILSEQMVDRGDFGVVQSGVGFPELNGDFDVSYDFSISDTAVNVAFGLFGQSLSFSSSVALDRVNGLSLILISDGNSSSSEIYEVNSLTLQSTQVSEPQYLAFFAFSLLGFLIYRRRQL